MSAYCSDFINYKWCLRSLILGRKIDRWIDGEKEERERDAKQWLSNRLGGETRRALSRFSGGRPGALPEVGGVAEPEIL